MPRMYPPHCRSTPPRLRPLAAELMAAHTPGALLQLASRHANPTTRAAKRNMLTAMRVRTTLGGRRYSRSLLLPRRQSLVAQLISRSKTPCGCTQGSGVGSGCQQRPGGFVRNGSGRRAESSSSEHGAGIEVEVRRHPKSAEHAASRRRSGRASRGFAFTRPLARTRCRSRCC
jgi:hypothetical protein